MKIIYELALISLAILLSFDFALALKLPKINIANKGKYFYINLKTAVLIISMTINFNSEVSFKDFSFGSGVI